MSWRNSSPTSGTAPSRCTATSRRATQADRRAGQARQPARARGDRRGRRRLDIDGISHVVNYDMPMVAEDYIHRIGRTEPNRSATGTAVSFVGPCKDFDSLRSIERLIGSALDREGNPRAKTAHPRSRASAGRGSGKSGSGGKNGERKPCKAGAPSAAAAAGGSARPMRAAVAARRPPRRRLGLRR
ncbi:MAG: helicase-related protein [Verrucomicrobiales bacterium]